MLRILLKRFIIQCTRIARHRMNITREKESGFEIVRQYYNLVDEHYRTKKQVQDYADMLHKSPKTLSNIFFYLQTAFAASGYPRTGGSGS